MNKTDDVYANDIKISSLYLYDWNDKNNNTRVTSNELSLISRAGSWGTVQELRITEPNEKFEGIPLVGVYPVPTRYSFWLGDIKTKFHVNGLYIICKLLSKTKLVCYVA